MGHAQQKNHGRKKLRPKIFIYLSTKLIVRKDEKEFDATKCRLVDDTLGNKFLDYFPLGNGLIPGVKVDVHCFKITPPKLCTSPSQIYIRIRLRRGPQKSGHILPQKPKKWEIFRTISFGLLEGNT